MALDPATGRPRWSRPADAANPDDTGTEVAVADAAGVTILAAATGAVRDRLQIDLDTAVLAPADQPPSRWRHGDRAPATARPPAWCRDDPR